MRRFRSKIDSWLIVLMVSSLGVLAFAAYDVVRSDMSGWQGPLTLLVLSASAALLTWFMLGTYYEVGNGDLNIASGPIRWRIRLADIESVEPSNSLISSPALSIDRLKIRYAGRQVMVSPADKTAFVAAIGQPTVREHRS